MENLDPLPPKSRMGKWRVFALRAPSSLIWGVDRGLLFPFILSKIVANDRFLGNICSEPSRMAKIFESPRTAKNFENVSW